MTCGRSCSNPSSSSHSFAMQYVPKKKRELKHSSSSSFAIPYVLKKDRKLMLGTKKEQKYVVANKRNVSSSPSIASSLVASRPTRARRTQPTPAGLKWRAAKRPYLGPTNWIVVFHLVTDLPVVLIELICDYEFGGRQRVFEIDRATGFPVKVLEIILDYDTELACSPSCSVPGCQDTKCEDDWKVGVVRHYSSSKECRLHSSCWDRVVCPQNDHFLGKQSLLCVCGIIAVSFSTEIETTFYKPVFHPPYAIHRCYKLCDWSVRCPQQHAHRDPYVICNVTCPYCPSDRDYDSDDNSVSPPYSSEDEVYFEFVPRRGLACLP